MILLWIVVPLAVYLVGAIIAFNRIGSDAEGMDHASAAGIWMLILFSFKVVGALFWPLIVVATVWGWIENKNK